LVEDNKAYILEMFDAARKEKNHALRMARRDFTAKAVPTGFNKSVRDEAARVLAKAEKVELERNEKNDNHDESTGVASDDT
jgi:1,2-phenylacetyl-CoA epoxidase catalytic subunit